MQNIIITPVGIIHTPYKNIEDIPIQGIFGNNVAGYVELNILINLKILFLAGWRIILIINGSIINSQIKYYLLMIVRQVIHVQ